MPKRHIVYISSRVLYRGLLDSRWIMAPFYVGLIISMLALLFIFFRELIGHLSFIMTMGSSEAIVMALSLIDLSLVANLLLIVALAGYENFVSRIESDAKYRPSWMGSIDFAGMKMKIMASISAISSIALLRIFMKMSEGAVVDFSMLRWMVIIHVALLMSTVLLAVTDRLGAVSR